ncbi:MAG: ISKra4 family transposase [Acidobacteria bacterium]|nr:ISKra4 family transposase [Acidobacteriota bacterium]
MTPRDLMETLIGFLKSEKGHCMTVSDLEREIQDGGRELLRSLLQSHLNTRSPGEAAAPVRDAGQMERDRVQLHERNVETVFGTVAVTRAGYGAEGKESLHPLDAALNLPDELYSLEVRRRVAEEAAKNSFDETMQTIVRNTGAEVPKRQIGELVVRAAQDFDLFYQTRRDCTSAEGATGPIVVISVDGKGVVMRREDLRKTTRKAAESATHKMSKRLSRGEKRNAKRMATVAVTYTIEPHVRSAEDIVRRMAPIRSSEPGKRPAPELKRVWASLEQAPESVIAEAFKEAEFRDLHRHKSWVALIDGNKTQIKILKAKARQAGVDLTIVVDVIHVSEYLWDAGTAFHSEATPELEQWVSARLLEILRGNSSNVAAGMRRSATLRGLAPNERKPVDSCVSAPTRNCMFLADVKVRRFLRLRAPSSSSKQSSCNHLLPPVAVIYAREIRRELPVGRPGLLSPLDGLLSHHKPHFQTGQIHACSRRRPHLRKLPSQVQAASALRRLPHQGIPDRDRCDRRSLPSPGQGPYGPDRRQMDACQCGGRATAPCASLLRRLRRVLGLPRSTRTREKPRLEVRRQPPSRHRRNPYARHHSTQTGQVIVVALSNRMKTSLNGKEPHPIYLVQRLI